jgi:hypothetical protein
MGSFTWTDGETGKVNKALDCAIVGLRTAYLAVESTTPDGSRCVWAAVVLLQFCRSRSRYGGQVELGTKQMSEDMGPNETACPLRILKMLTPLPEAVPGEPDPYQYARAWRLRCWERAARRAAWPKLSLGMRLVPIDGVPRKMWVEFLDREVEIGELTVVDKYGRTKCGGRPNMVLASCPASECYRIYFRPKSFDLHKWRVRDE